eukprot:TRINITY_DN5322_c0_g1_i1.p1 TRINITY_DN5322_c0_g1~~TRINITY_DN5322_c0_g1_i1.p1  ORF type:complete len:506 (-),score=156.14 TRINITY_DN5322_c0_g1_i1:32-1549(-)
MAIRDGFTHTINTNAFVLETLRGGKQRIDGRELNTLRQIAFQFTRSEGQASVLVQWGRTQTLAVVSAEVVPPYPDRPTDGALMFNVELSKMAEASVGLLRASPLATEITRIIERGIRDSQALDTETLCIVAGEKVWQLRVDVHILDNGGNLVDAAALAAIAALQHFRRPDVTVSGEGFVEVHHSDEREAQPLALHHVPLCITFALFDDMGKQRVVVDPDEVEEAVMKGRVTIALNAHREVCTLHKNGGMAMSAETLLACADVAAAKVVALHERLREELQKADAAARQAREQRLRGGAAFASHTAHLASLMQAAQPMDETADLTRVGHLGYDDLHVTGKVRDVPERALGGGARGLQGDEAAKSALFAQMAKAAADASAGLELKLGNAPMGKRKGKDTASGVGDAELDEFDKVAAGLKQQAASGARSIGGTVSAPALAADDAMDSGSEEEQVVVLKSSFKTGNDAASDTVAAAAAAKAPAQAGDSDDDLMAAVKSKPKGKGKARQKK